MRELIEKSALIKKQEAASPSIPKPAYAPRTQTVQNPVPETSVAMLKRWALAVITSKTAKIAGGVVYFGAHIPFPELFVVDAIVGFEYLGWRVFRQHMPAIRRGLVSNSGQPVAKRSRRDDGDDSAASATKT
jgi:hypothetical protein